MTQHSEEQERPGAAPLVAVLEARRPNELAALLRHRGLEPYHAPAMREEITPDPATVAAFIDRLSGGQVSVVILLTGVGTAALLDTAATLGRRAELEQALRRVTVLARGPKPVAALRAAGLRADLIASAPYTTEQVLAALEGSDLAERGVAVQLAGEPNPELRQGLEQRGARVEELLLYRWAMPDDDGPLLRLIDGLTAGRIAAVVVTSSPQVHNLFAVAARHGGEEALRHGLSATIVASVGPVCTRTLHGYGISADVEPTPPKMGPLVAALAARLSQE